MSKIQFCDFLRVTSMTADSAKAFFGRQDEPIDLGPCGPRCGPGARVWGFIDKELTPAMRALLSKVMQRPGLAIYVRGTEVRIARSLEAMGLGSLRDDGNVTRAGRVDGERWFFDCSGVT